jgi:hypothetical protein
VNSLPGGARPLTPLPGGARGTRRGELLAEARDSSVPSPPRGEEKTATRIRHIRRVPLAPPGRGVRGEGGSGRRCLHQGDRPVTSAARPRLPLGRPLGPDPARGPSSLEAVGLADRELIAAGGHNGGPEHSREAPGIIRPSRLVV